MIKLILKFLFPKHPKWKRVNEKHRAEYEKDSWPL